uniref:Uncharacterized protein n=1 Tax=Emiliania huxleyi TaxID=2903 RepID=A0A7S3WD57_EMIHU
MGLRRTASASALNSPPLKSRAASVCAQLRGLEQMMAAHAPRTEAEYARDIGSIFNSYCTAAEGFTDRKKKDKSATICASRASNTLENLFRAPPKGWSKMGSGSADIPSADPRQVRRRRRRTPTELR